MVEPQVKERTDGFVRTEIIGSPRTDCFSLERFDIRRECRFAAEGDFSALYVLSGRGRLESEAASLEVMPGDQFFVPAAAKDFSLAAEDGDELAIFRAKSAILQTGGHNHDQT